jgi:adenylate cyclase
MGIHYWLKTKPWYPYALPILRAVALLLPVLALLGFADVGRGLAARAVDPAWMASVFGNVSHADEATVESWGSYAVAAFVTCVALVFVGRWIRGIWDRRKGVVRLTYPTGRRVAITPGTTILEASRAAGIPHASVCGGRGRSSTCRSRVGPEWQRLPRPAPDEERVLQRVAAPPNVRLACQLRPAIDLEIYPLLPPSAQPADGFLRPGYTQGTEQEIAILFADIRSFTHFAEHRLPFDVVFVLNRYFAAMGEAIARSGGLLDKFIGDGVMALFGLSNGPERGCREALTGALAMARALEELNRTLANDLQEPLRIGIGIHAGPVIVGEMGHGRATSLTAIGDAVNTASRLESMNKEFKSQLIVSEVVATRAGVDLSAFPRHEIEVRGRTTAMPIRVIERATDLAPLLGGERTVAPSS